MVDVIDVLFVVVLVAMDHFVIHDVVCLLLFVVFCSACCIVAAVVLSLRQLSLLRFMQEAHIVDDRHTHTRLCLSRNGGVESIPFLI